MNRRILSTVTGLMAMVVALCPRMATADEGQPFSADAVVEAVDDYKNGFLIEGIGEATHLGEVAVVGEVRLFGDRSTSTIMLTAANGDSLVLESTAEFDPDAGHFVGTFIVCEEEGTGRFSGATGHGTIEPIPIGPGQFNVLLDGWISY